MDASIKESVRASDKEAQYDEKAKKLLGHKIILAYILVNTVEEFRGMNPKDVVKYIEGEPHISTVPIDPGMTNTKAKKEESESIKEIPEQIIGSHNWKGDLELLNIVMIGISEDLPEKGENYELHRLLSALLSSGLEVEDKLNIIEKEYDILIEDDMREEVEQMCNLSQGIKEQAFKVGKESGYVEIICKMYQSGLPIEQIANITKMSVDKVEELLKSDLLQAE